MTRMGQTEQNLAVSTVSFRDRDMFVMAYAHLTNHIFIQTHLALIPVFMKEFNLSLSLVGVMVMIPLLAESIAGIPAGLMSDKVGYFRQIMISLGMVVVAAIVMSQASNPLMVVLALCFSAVAVGIYHPPAYGAVSHMFDAKRNRGLGIHGAGGMLAWATGPLSVGALMATIGWRGIYLVWIPPIMICIAVLMRMGRREIRASTLSQASSDAGLRSMLTGGFVTVIAMMAVGSLGAQTVTTLISPYMVLFRGFSVQTASYLMGLISLTGIVAAPAGGFIADKIGEKKVLTVAFLASTSALVGFIYSSQIEMLFLFGVLYGFVTNFRMAPSTSLVSYFTPKARRGFGYALYFFPTYMAQAAAPVIGTLLAESRGFSMPFFLAMALLLGSATILQKVPSTE